MSLAGGAALTLSRGGDSADPAPDLPDRLNLAFDVGKHGSIAVAPQSFVDEGTEHHLEALIHEKKLGVMKEMLPLLE